MFKIAVVQPKVPAGRFPVGFYSIGFVLKNIVFWWCLNIIIVLDIQLSRDKSTVCQMGYVSILVVNPSL